MWIKYLINSNQCQQSPANNQLNSENLQTNKIIKSAKLIHRTRQQVVTISNNADDG